MELKGIKVGVFSGGISEERNISLLSGRQVFSVFAKKKIDADFIDITADCPEKIADIIAARRIDLAFVALHGLFGEDGQIQNILESIPLAYTGSGPEASRLAMDKIASKSKFEKAGLPMPSSGILSPQNYDCAGITYPAVVKPYCSGSSFGISIVREKKQLAKALESASGYNKLVIAEEYIEGRELTVGILGGRPLAVVEILPQRNYFDFTAKYSKGKCEYKVPARLDPNTYKEVQKVALAAHNALGCRDFSRVDIRLRKNQPYLLEVNSIPGLTSRSLLPLSAAACGIGFDELITVLAKRALARGRALAK